MKSEKLANVNINDYVVTATSEQDPIATVSCIAPSRECEAVAKITIDGSSYVISAQAGNYISSGTLSVVSLDDYAEVSAQLSSDGRFYFTYRADD